MNGQGTIGGLRVASGGGRTPGHPSRTTRRRVPAFSLMEVMIAVGVFFMAMFAILALISSSLRSARALQRNTVDAGMVAAMLTAQFSVTNQVYEGAGSGDFGKAYPDYAYDWDLYEIGTNHLCQLDIIVQRRTGSRPVESVMSVLLFVPNLQGGSLSRGLVQ